MNSVRRNKVLLFVFVTLLVLSLGLASIFASAFTSKAMADTTAVGTVVFESDAEIRAKANVNDTGIRFTAKLDTALAGALFTTNNDSIADGFKTGCSIGMIIVPKQALAAVEAGEDYLEVIKEKFGREESDIAVNFTFEDHNIFANFDNQDELTLDANYPYSVKGAIVGLNVANLKYEYQAVVYYSTDNGATRVYSEKSSAVNFAEKANSVLATEEFESDVKNTVVGYVAKTILMQETGSVAGYSLTNNVTTIAIDNFVKVGDTLTFAELFDYTTGTQNFSNIAGITNNGGVLSATGFAKGTVTTSAYDGALQYNYTVNFYPETETDIATGDFGTNYVNVSSVSFGSRTFELASGVATFAITGEDDARDLASEKEQVISVEIDSETYLAKVTVWSMLVETLNIADMAQYQYKRNNEATFGAFKLVEDIEVTNLPASQTMAQLGFDCEKLGGGSTEGSGTLSRGFSGVFDGNNHTITIATGSTSVAPNALFYNLKNGTVKNLRIVEESGAYAKPLIAIFGAGFTIDNVSIRVEANSGSIDRSATAVAYIFGDKDVLFKDFSIEYPNVPQTWAIEHTPFIAGTSNSEGHVISSRFSGKIVCDNVNLFFTADALSRWNYNSADHPSNFYTKLVYGPAYSNVTFVSKNVYTADSFPAIDAIADLTEVTIYKGNTLTTADTAIVMEKKTATPTVEKDVEFSFASVLPSGTTLRQAYQVVVDESEKTIAGQTVTLNEKTYVRESATKTFDTAGTYEYFVISSNYDLVYATITVIAPQIETYTTEVARDLKDGINIAGLLSEAGFEADTTVNTATLGSTALTITDGAVSFGAVADMTDATKMLASEDAYTLTLMSSTKKYIFSNFKLYSILVSDADEYDTAYLYQTADGYKANGGKGYWAVIGFDADVTLNALTATTTLGPASSSSSAGFTGVIDGRGHKVSGVTQSASVDALKGKCLASTGRGATLKNIELTFSSNSMYGIFGRYSRGIKLIDVTINSKISTFGGGGFLYYDYTGSEDMILKNVTIISSCTLASLNNCSRVWLGNPYTSSSSYGFTGKFVVDNLNLVSSGDRPMKLVGGLAFTYGVEHVGGYGDVFVKAEGATKGITFYTSKADYTAGTNGVEATTEVVETPINATVGTALTVNTLVGEGKTFLYAQTSLSTTATSSTSVNSNGTSVTYTTAGTFKLLVVSTDYVNYIYTVNVTAA